MSLSTRGIPPSKTPIRASALWGLCLGALPMAALADQNIYTRTHAEITVGTGNAEVRVGKTWETGGREVVVEKVTHEYPQRDHDDDDRDYGRHRDDDDEVVIIEKRREPPRKKVVIVEKYAEPCERERVIVRRVYERPRCERERVIVKKEVRYVEGPSRTVIVGPPGHVKKWKKKHHEVDYRPRDLFEDDHGRPGRGRGVHREWKSYAKG